jgi:hypothetical protein
MMSFHLLNVRGACAVVPLHPSQSMQKFSPGRRQNFKKCFCSNWSELLHVPAMESIESLVVSRTAWSVGVHYAWGTQGKRAKCEFGESR